ncbi:hypothetical protein SAMN05660236_1326 [Ohtaekwangia koreensis]|uniref:Uncharacterized protein n=1 Tax=Ohtaekwangia koreensis TaxID=688867 RepID=A0A1T5JPN6_9BACT|nr:hypothetical protein SAMN05660236_1326 [Ohtaekwangia koreensis]
MLSPNRKRIYVKNYDEMMLELYTAVYQRLSLNNAARKRYQRLLHTPYSFFPIEKIQTSQYD